MQFSLDRVDMSKMSNQEINEMMTGMIDEINDRKISEGASALADPVDLMIMQAACSETIRRMIAAGDTAGAKAFAKRIKGELGMGGRDDG